MCAVGTNERSTLHLLSYIKRMGNILSPVPKKISKAKQAVKSPDVIVNTGTGLQDLPFARYEARGRSEHENTRR